MTAVLAGLLGLLLGSFAAAIITRYPHRSAMSGRSMCPKCRVELRAIDLIPVVSFALTGGKCRYCHREIAWTYPLVEASTAVGFALIASFVTPVGVMVVTAALWWVSMVLTGIDFRTMKLPNIWTGLAAGLVLLLGICRVLADPNTPWLPALLLAVAVLVFYLTLSVLTRGRGMGFGDVKLAPIAAGAAALTSVGSGVLAAVLPFFLGVAFVAFRAGRGIPWRGEYVPFGPFLIAAAWLAGIFGEPMTASYLALFTPARG